MPENIKTKILERIERGEVRMRPRAYFLLKIGVTILISFILILAIIFSISFVIYSIHESSELIMRGFSELGFWSFLLLFPWLGIAISIILAFLLEWLLRKFEFGYKIPVVNALLAIFITALVLGVLFNLTPAHKHLQDKADRDELPVLGHWYKSIETIDRSER